MNVAGCPLCEAPGGALVWQGPKFRVIRAHEAGFPAFWRVVWAEHVAEFSQLDRGDRIACMDAVAAVETAVIDLLQPTKLNLASLGNQVAHLHWHVIARFEWDSRFPAPVWAPALREADEAKLAAVASRVAYVDMAIARALAAPSPFAAGAA